MNAKQIILRLVSVFVTSAIPTIGVGSMLDVEPLTSAAQAGGAAVLTVLFGLAQAYKADGKLDEAEVEAAFASADDK